LQNKTRILWRKQNGRIKEKIENYVEQLLFLHDMSVGRNENNMKTKDRIVARCMSDLEKHKGLAEILQNDKQIEYFVRQTILYMV